MNWGSTAALEGARTHHAMPQGAVAAELVSSREPMGRDLPDYLQHQLHRLKLSVTEVCTQADITRETWYRLTRGEISSPSVHLLAKLAAVFRVSPLALLQLAYADCRGITSTGMRRLQADHYSFVRDVTVPDGMPVLPGQTFLKTWEIQNTSSFAWVGREFRCMDEQLVLCRRGVAGQLQPLLDVNLLPEAPMIALPRVEPRQIVSLSMRFKAPAHPGSVLSLWKMFDAEGVECNSSYPGLWTKVVVMGL